MYTRSVSVKVCSQSSRGSKPRTTAEREGGKERGAKRGRVMSAFLWKQVHGLILSPRVISNRWQVLSHSRPEHLVCCVRFVRAVLRPCLGYAHETKICTPLLRENVLTKPETVLWYFGRKATVPFARVMVMHNTAGLPRLLRPILQV